MRTFPYALAILLVTPVCTSAQDQALPLRPGARVRVTYWRLDLTCPPATCFSSKERTDGTLKAVLADTLILERHGGADVLAVPFFVMSKLEVVHGRKAMTWKGARIGALVGSLVGAVLMAATFEKPACDPCIVAVPTDPFLAALLGFGVGAEFGFLGGAVVGSFFHGDRWEKVPFPQLGASVVPQRDRRLALAATLAF